MARLPRGGRGSTAVATSTGGSRSTGGTASTGGSRSTGGTERRVAPDPRAVHQRQGVHRAQVALGTKQLAGADPTEFALMQAWLNNTTAVSALPSYAYSNIKTNFAATNATTPHFTFNRLACTIAMTCVEFAPMETDWLRKCEAVLTSAIVAESSYNPSSSVASPANDPTVGCFKFVLVRL